MPHILGKIFFSLDYESFKNCLEVNTAWKELLTAESYQKKGKSLFHGEILDDKEQLWQAARKGNVLRVQTLLSVFVDVNSARGWMLSTPLCEASIKWPK